MLKTRIAVLWLFMTVASILHYVLVSPEEQQFLSAAIKQAGTLLSVATAAYVLIPLVMAFLSVTLNDLANRRVNLVIGIVFTIINIVHILGCPVAYSSAHQILIVLSTIAVSLLIVWYAWKWPKEEP